MAQASAVRRSSAYAHSASGRLPSETASDALSVEMEGLGCAHRARINPLCRPWWSRVSDLFGDKDGAHDAHCSPWRRRSRSSWWRGWTGCAGVERTSLPVRQLGEPARLLLKVPGLGSPVTWQQLLDRECLFPQDSPRLHRVEDARVPVQPFQHRCPGTHGKAIRRWSGPLFRGVFGRLGVGTVSVHAVAHLVRVACDAG